VRERVKLHYPAASLVVITTCRKVLEQDPLRERAKVGVVYFSQ
jgi:hypothetical protein